MKVVVAIDSFKGSLSSMEAGNAIKEGILQSNNNAEIIVKPIADGGEGTKEALLEGLGGKRILVPITDHLGNKILGDYGVIEDRNIAIIEMATAAGITLVKGKLRPMESTTYGVGEMIHDAIKKGCREFFIGIGGSATNDVGIGLLEALGYEFLDSKGNRVGAGAQVLGKINRICDANRVKELDECTFKIVCDVTNPLYGTYGATQVYGGQKGLTESEISSVDEGVQCFAQKVVEYSNRDDRFSKGAGAAGGLGFALLSFLDAQFYSGIEVVLDAIRLEESIQLADIIVTGEGRIDQQTAMGKGPIGIAKIAKKYNKRVIALSGSIGEGAEICNEEGIDAFFCIQRGAIGLAEAMDKDTAYYNMKKTAEQIFRLLGDSCLS